LNTKEPQGTKRKINIDGIPADNEMVKLEAMLDEAGIPYDVNALGDKYLTYPSVTYPNETPIVCSVILTPFSYGHEEGLLEIDGLLTDEEKENDDVAGWLTAAEVFRRIKFHYGFHGGKTK